MPFIPHPYSLADYCHALDEIATIPSARPLIGVTTNEEDLDYTLRQVYCHQILAAGGTPLLLPPTDNLAVIASYIDTIDALLLTGGGDCDPRWLGEETTEKIGHITPHRDLPELLLAATACQRTIPVLAICRGMQMLAIALGGHVVQDISLDAHWDSQRGLHHSQTAPRDVPTHNVTIVPNSTLYNIYKTSELHVNSFHHQTTDRLPTTFRAIAYAPDGVIEAMESSQCKPFVAVQWHPEWLGTQGQPLFQWLITEATTYRQARQIHDKNISVDSHCDTPMFFPYGADFTKRDEKIKVDYFKMLDGRLDAVTMAAYIPQPNSSQTWRDIAPIASTDPYDYANIILDTISRLVDNTSLPLAIARNTHDLITNKHLGRKSILLAIENGLPIDTDLSRLTHFKSRGITYITLCHNGDNQLCDSAQRSVSTHHGLSPFGAQVVSEMNRLGIIVDLSHAATTTFYDVLQLSTRPVVCSHSNCYALCPHPRNLSDDQLRHLAKHDGVCQMTLYNGFVHTTPHEADIHHFIQHIVHAVQIMGVDHVGIGSDFDGDGGITGLNDAGDYVNLTMHLLRQHFSLDDLHLLLGGNWLRVMSNNSL